LQVTTISCASIEAGLYLSSVDHNDGEVFLQREPEVRAYLENIQSHPANFRIKAYKRTAIGIQMKRTKLLSHDYYVITHIATGKFNTLSFGGTKMAFYSTGAWQMDTDSDTASYQSFINGDNKWDVEEIPVATGIDTERTVGNIIAKIDSEVKYYYRDHIKNKAGYDNCNTALDETLAAAGLER